MDLAYIELFVPNFNYIHMILILSTDVLLFFLLGGGVLKLRHVATLHKNIDDIPTLKNRKVIVGATFIFGSSNALMHRGRDSDLYKALGT